MYPAKLPAMPRRTKEEAQATRSRILDTAELVFEQRGVSNTSLNEIAKAAELTRGAIYWHFEDKADLFNAMMQRATLPLEAAEGVACFKSADATLADLRDGFVGVLKWLTTDPRAARVFEIATHKVELVDAMAAVRQRQLTMRDGCVADVERTCRRAIGAGELPPGISPRAAAIGLVALFDGLLHNWMLDRSAFDLTRTARVAIDAYLRGLAG